MLSSHSNLNVESLLFFFQAEDGIRDLVRSRGLGDVYKRQAYTQAKLSTEFFRTVNRICCRHSDSEYAVGKPIYLSLIHI